MNKKDVLKLIGIATLASSSGALAQSPDWTYAEASYLSSEFDEDLLSDIEPEGFELKGSYAFTDNWFVQGAYNDQDDDVSVPGFPDVNVEFSSFNIGGGYAHPLSENTHIYGRAAFESWDFEVDDFDEDDQGYSAAAGIRAVVWEGLELNAEVGYIDVGDFFDGEGFFEIGGIYTLDMGLANASPGSKEPCLKKRAPEGALIRYRFSCFNLEVVDHSTVVERTVEAKRRKLAVGIAYTRCRTRVVIRRFVGDVVGTNDQGQAQVFPAVANFGVHGPVGVVGIAQGKVFPVEPLVRPVVAQQEAPVVEQVGTGDRVTRLRQALFQLIDPGVINDGRIEALHGSIRVVVGQVDVGDTGAPVDAVGTDHINTFRLRIEVVHEEAEVADVGRSRHT
jgi:hypothetical protein